MSKEKVSLTSAAVRPQDLDVLRTFLRDNALPSDDIRLDGSQFFFYYKGREMIGSGGLEFYGDFCLLRSLAVAMLFRGNGCGIEIVRDLIVRASGTPVRGVYLLTNTAQSFFERFGFEKRSRDDTPAEIKLSSEFSTVCPVSAVVMSLDLMKQIK